MNDPKVIAKLLRAMAGGQDHIESKANIIFDAAADLLDQNAELKVKLSDLADIAKKRAKKIRDLNAIIMRR